MVDEGEENQENEGEKRGSQSSASESKAKGNNDRRAKLEEYLKEKKKLTEAKRTGSKPVFKPGGGAYKDVSREGRGAATSPFGNTTLASTRNITGGMRRGPSSMNLSRAPSSLNLMKSSMTNLSRVASSANLTKMGTPGNRSVMGKKPLLKSAALTKKTEARKPVEVEKQGLRRSARSKKAPEVLAGPGGSTRAKKKEMPAIEVQPSSASSASTSSSASSSQHTISAQPIAGPSFAPEGFAFSLNLKPPTSNGISTPKDGDTIVPRDFGFSSVHSASARNDVEEEEEHMEDEVFREEDEDQLEEEVVKQDQTEEDIDMEIKRSVRKNKAAKRMEKVLFPGANTLSVDSQDSNLSAADEISFKPTVASSLTPIGRRSSRRKSLLEVPPASQEKPSEEAAETKTPRGRRRSRRVSGVQPDPSLTEEQLARTPARRAKERSLSCDR